jgi:hypothetical protein
LEQGHEVVHHVEVPKEEIVQLVKWCYVWLVGLLEEALVELEELAKLVKPILVQLVEVLLVQPVGL